MTETPQPPQDQDGQLLPSSSEPLANSQEEVPIHPELQEMNRQIELLLMQYEKDDIPYNRYVRTALVYAAERIDKKAELEASKLENPDEYEFARNVGDELNKALKNPLYRATYANGYKLVKHGNLTYLPSKLEARSFWDDHTGVEIPPVIMNNMRTKADTLAHTLEDVIPPDMLDNAKVLQYGIALQGVALGNIDQMLRPLLTTKGEITKVPNASVFWNAKLYSETRERASLVYSMGVGKRMQEIIEEKAVEVYGDNAPEALKIWKAIWNVDYTSLDTRRPRAIRNASQILSLLTSEDVSNAQDAFRDFVGEFGQAISPKTFRILYGQSKTSLLSQMETEFKQRTAEEVERIRNEQLSRFRKDRNEFVKRALETGDKDIQEVSKYLGKIIKLRNGQGDLISYQLTHLYEGTALMPIQDERGWHYTNVAVQKGVIVPLPPNEKKASVRHYTIPEIIKRYKAAEADGACLIRYRLTNCFCFCNDLLWYPHDSKRNARRGNTD